VCLCLCLCLCVQVNPAHSRHGQKLHIDYSLTNAGLFVPLTKVTEQNSPETVDYQTMDPNDIDNGYAMGYANSTPAIATIPVLATASS
jgi:hypothetical protein